MANAVEVRVLGDASQLESALGRASSLLKKFGGDAVAAADAQVSAGVKTRAELEQMAAAYHVTADAAEQGSAKQQQAAALAAEADAKLAAQAKALADATMTAAQRNVAALVEQRDALERNVVEYQAIAAAAAKGSDEQIAANNLAAESARKLAAAYGEVSVAAKGSGAAASESGFARGVSSKLTGLGGWMAGPGFIAGAVGGLAIDQTVKAALAAADATAKLDQALRNAHSSVSALTPVLNAYDESAARLGFQSEDTKQAQVELVTAFGATKQALTELRDAEDLARLKNESLAEATQQLILLQEGNMKAAKQFGLAVPDLTMAVWHQKAAQDGLTVAQEKGKTLYDQLLPRIHDQAQAYANSPSGKIAAFHSEINQLEISIGNGLLPVVDRYLGSIDTWLSKGSNQKRVTADVKTVVTDLAGALETAVHATEDVLGVVGPVVNEFGGWKTVIEAIIGLKFISWLNSGVGELQTLGTTVAGVATKLGLLSSAETEVGAAAAAASIEAEGAFAGIGAAAYAALGPIGMLVGALGASYLAYKAVSDLSAQGPTQTIGPRSQTANVVGSIHMRNPILDQKGVLQGVPAYHHKGDHTVHGAVLSPAEEKAKAALAAANKALHWGPPTPPAGNSADTAGAAGSGKGAGKKTAYHIPVELENEIRKAQARFAQDASKRNLDTLVALYKKEDELMKSHGAKLPALSEIVTAEKTYASKLSAQQVAAAKSAIAAIEKGTVGPEQALKLAQAAGASTQILLSDQRDVLAAYQAEAAKLEGKLKTTTGKARLEVAAALAKIDQQISSVKDQVVSSLKSLAQAASQKLASSAATVESDVVSAFEKQTQDYINGPLAAQYFQGKDPTTGLARQTPAEAALAAMQQADQQQQLQDALTTAQQQLALDEKAANGPGSMTDKNNAQVLVDGVPVGGSSNPKLTQDEKAVQAAERAITENNLASQATAERARADAAYATAVQQYTDSRSVQEAKLKAALDTWAAGLTTGATTIGGLSGIAASFGLTLSGLADPTTGIGYDFSVLSGAAQDAAAALAVLTTAAGGSNTSFDAAVAAGALPAIVAALHGGAIPGAATGADILREGLLYVHAGERVQPAHIVRGNQAATGPVTIELHVNKRKVASAIAPTLDKTVRVVLS